MSLSALAMLQVTHAKRDHNTNCPWGKPAIEVHINPASLEGLGWVDGDDIAGLTVRGDDEVPRKRMVVYCDGDLQNAEEQSADIGEDVRTRTGVPGVVGVPA